MKKLLSIACLVVLLASTGHAQELFRALPETLHSGAEADATGKILKVEGWATVSVHVDGIVTATVTFQVSNDAALGWHNLTCTKSSDGTSVSSLTADGAVSCPVSGYKYFKAPISGYSDGTITVKTVQTTAASRGGGGSGSGVATSIAGSTTLPGTCTVGQVYFDTDEDANLRINVCTATDTWAPLLETEIQSLDDVCTIDCEITTAVSEATGFAVGDGTNKVTRYWDATGGAYDKPSPLGDSLWRVWTNFDGCVYDEESAAKMFCYDPDAATPRAKYLFKTGYFPLKSVYLPAGFWDGDGTQCPAAATAVTINSGPKLLTFICADNSGSTLYAALILPPDYVAGTTLAFTQRVIQTAANTGSLNGDISAQCRGNGETPSSTWGTAIALDDAALTGSNANDFITSAAVTPAGTCNPGDSLYLRYVFDSASTTASASLHFVGFDMAYSSESLSH